MPDSCAAVKRRLLSHASTGRSIHKLFQNIALRLGGFSSYTSGCVHRLRSSRARARAYQVSTPASNSDSFTVYLPRCLPKPPRASILRRYVVPLLNNHRLQSPFGQTSNLHINLSSHGTGHGQQDLTPLPNPRHTTYHPRRQDRHPSRSRYPRRPLPSPFNRHIHRSQQPAPTIQRPQRRNHRRPLQLYLQECSLAPA